MKTNSRRIPDFNRRVLLLLVVTLLFSLYILLRYNGMFASNDVSVHSRVAATIKATGSLTANPTYSNGFGYPALVAVISSFTGIPVSMLQLYIMPLFLTVPILAAYTTCREILGERQAVFAGLVVLLHPFFLFSAFRSTHEKFTYTFVLLTLYCIYITLSADNEFTKVRMSFSAYLMLLGVIFFNVYFASAMITAIGLTWIMGLVISKFNQEALPLRRLFYPTLISSSLLLFFIFFLYPPARRFLQSIGSVSIQTLVLLFGSAPAAVTGGPSPYAPVLTRWPSLPTYLSLISIYFLVYPIAGLYWLGRARFYWKKSAAREDIQEVFLLLVSAAFGILLAGAIIADQTGLLGSNMQLRVFPLLGFVSIILTTRVVFGLIDENALNSISDKIENDTIVRIRSQMIPVIIIILLVGFSATGVLKATNDTIVSGVWTDATDDEQASIQWMETHTRNEVVWSGYSPRIRQAHQIRFPEHGLRNRYELRTIHLAVRYVIISDTIKMQAEVREFPLPPRSEASRIYSNGHSHVYWFERYRTFDEYNDAWR